MNPQQPSAAVGLGKREKLILRLLTIHGPSPRIADVVGLSERHTRRVIRQLQERVGVDNTHALVAWAAVNLSSECCWDTWPRAKVDEEDSG